NLFLLTKEHVGIQVLLGEASEHLDRVIAVSFKKDEVADQRDPFQPTLAVAAGIELAAIVRADDAVASNKPSHSECVDRPLGKERQHLSFVGGCELLHDQGSYPRRQKHRP